MSQAEREWAISLNHCATYTFSRERNEKRREGSWTFDRQELIQNHVVYNFLEDNICRIFNLRESFSVKGPAGISTVEFSALESKGSVGHG